MKKQTKEGEKRRSTLKEKLSSESFQEQLKVASKTYKANDYFLTLNYLCLLFDAFEAGELKVKNKKLYKDIKTTKELIGKIEDDYIDVLENIKKHNLTTTGKHMGYNQKYLKKLSFILEKTPITISIDFPQYYRGIRRSRCSQEDGYFSLPDTTQAKKIMSKEVLKRARFYSFVKDSIPDEEDSDNTLRHYLTVGLFDYLQRLILQEPHRPRRCRVCGKWFLMSRRDHCTCSVKCKDRYWLTNGDGRWVRKIKMREVRKKIIANKK